jgi:hypothetical protein
MKLKHLVTVLAVACLSLTATSSRAEGLKFLAGLQPDYTFAPTLAVSAGVMNVRDGRGDADFLFGLDVNFNCLLLQTPENRLRTHLQVNHSDHKDVTSTSFELAPRYTLPVGGGFAANLGPVVALVLADNGRADRSLFGYGAVAGVEYRTGIFYSGVDLRYLNTVDRDSVDFENWALLAKAGVNF